MAFSFTTYSICISIGFTKIMPPASYCLCFLEFHKHIPTGISTLQSVFEGIKSDSPLTLQFLNSGNLQHGYIPPSFLFACKQPFKSLEAL